MYLKFFNYLEIVGCDRSLCVTDEYKEGLFCFSKLDDGFVVCAFKKQVIVSCIRKAERAWKKRNEYEEYTNIRDSN